jgi:hypothetical protein
MTIKDLTFDQDCADRSISNAATLKNGDSVNVAYNQKFLYVAVNTAATVTVTPRVTIGGTTAAIKSDLDGNSYPRASFTGGLMTFAVIPGSGVKLGCTLPTGSFMHVKSAK